MEKLKNTAKGGWHSSGKDGGKESWRGDFKGIGQVAGWMGKGKSSSSYDEALSRQTRPLAALKDPDAFGPPPKNVRYHGGAAVPDAITPDRSALGASNCLREESHTVEHGADRTTSQEDSQKPTPPPVPFRANRTGFSTATLPKPPKHKALQDAGSETAGISEGLKPKPSLPPRLPPRQNSVVSQEAPPVSSPSYGPITQARPTPAALLNQGALSRLGSAGVSVPGFGIGTQPKDTNPWQNEPSTSTSKPSSSRFNSAQGVNELQSRFAKFSPSTSSDSPSQGTTFAEKQAALKTASAFRNNPSSVTLSDGKAAASTINNFRQRHGDQVAAGWQTAGGLNKKYGISDKISNIQASTGNVSSNQVVQSPPDGSGIAELPATPVPVKKAAPPPPPLKRIGVGGSSTLGSPPPPVPLSTKPR